jgi:hypothetical protein
MPLMSRTHCNVVLDIPGTGIPSLSFRAGSTGLQAAVAREEKV